MTKLYKWRIRYISGWEGDPTTWKRESTYGSKRAAQEFFVVLELFSILIVVVNIQIYMGDAIILNVIHTRNTHKVVQVKLEKSE